MAIKIKAVELVGCCGKCRYYTADKDPVAQGHLRQPCGYGVHLSHRLYRPGLFCGLQQRRILPKGRTTAAAERHSAQTTLPRRYAACRRPVRVRKHHDGLDKKLPALDVRGRIALRTSPSGRDTKAAGRSYLYLHAFTPDCANT